jgi:hypothetical protein
MSYVKRIICLANSFKHGGTCIAGKELLAGVPDGGIGPWIRPVSSRPTGELSIEECRYRNYQMPRMLDIVEVALVRALPRGHQVENYLLDPTHRFVRVGVFPSGRMRELCDEPAALWADGESTERGHSDFVSHEEAAGEKYSLALIRPDQFQVRVENNGREGQRSYRGDFTYNEKYYSLSLTDPLVRNGLAGNAEGEYQMKDACICVSLALPYGSDRRCHKLVAAVIGAQPFVENKVWKSASLPSGIPTTP